MIRKKRSKTSFDIVLEDLIRPRLTLPPPREAAAIDPSWMEKEDVTERDVKSWMTFAVFATFVLHLGRPLSSTRNRSPPLSPFLLPSSSAHGAIETERIVGKAPPPIPVARRPLFRGAVAPGRSGARNSLFLSSRSLFLACCLHSFLPPPSEQLSLPLPLLVLGARSVGGGDGVASTLSRAGIRNFF